MVTLVSKIIDMPKAFRTVDSLPIRRFIGSAAITIVFVGSEKSGTKTSFISKYSAGTFTESPQRHIKAPEVKKVQVNGVTVEVNLIDAPGSERYFSSYLKTAAAVVVGYDITSKESFHSIHKICEFIKAKFPHIFMMIVGGMYDKIPNRAVSSEEGRSYSKSVGANLFFEGNNYCYVSLYTICVCYL